MCSIFNVKWDRSHEIEEYDVDDLTQSKNIKKTILPILFMIIIIF